MHTDLRSIAVGRPERGARGAAFASFFSVFSGISSYRCVLIVVILRVWYSLCAFRILVTLVGVIFPMNLLAIVPEGNDGASVSQQRS